MNVGNIVQPNTKGQIVIPKQIRNLLGITPKTPLNVMVRGTGIYLQPIVGVITKSDGEDLYGKILDQTRGAWRDDKAWDELEKQRRRVELASTKKNKQAW